MNLQQAYDLLNFFINKKLGYYYSPPEIDLIVDRGSLSLYSDWQPKYATSQKIKDALSTFKDTYTFTTSDTANGIIAVPLPTALVNPKNYLNLLSISITYIDSNSISREKEVEVVNEDELTQRKNSQIDPPTAIAPIAESIGFGQFQLYPIQTYAGNVKFLRRPKAPLFAYSVVSGRVIVYDPTNSIQIEWSEIYQDDVLIKALQSAGINLDDQELSQFAELKSTQNFQGVNRF